MTLRAAALLLAAPLLAGLALPGAARAETRTLSRINGWTAFDGTTADGVATCGLETRDPRTGRHFLLQRSAGQDPPVLRLSRPGWNLPAGVARPVRLVIDNRRIFAASAAAAGHEMSWPVTLEGPDGFEPAFRLGALMRIEFPGGPDGPWNLSLTGTNAVMGAFMGCLRMLAIQPGEAPPAMTPPLPPPAVEPLRPPPAEPLRPPVEAPAPPAEPPIPAPPAPAAAPRGDLPSDKPSSAEPKTESQKPPRLNL